MRSPRTLWNINVRIPLGIVLEAFTSDHIVRCQAEGASQPDWFIQLSAGRPKDHNPLSFPAMGQEVGWAPLMPPSAFKHKQKVYSCVFWTYSLLFAFLYQLLHVWYSFYSPPQSIIYNWRAECYRLSWQGTKYSKSRAAPHSNHLLLLLCR